MSGRGRVRSRARRGWERRAVDGAGGPLQALRRRSRRRRVVLQWPMLAWIVVVWVLLWGSLSWGAVAAGILVALGIAYAFPMPPVDYSGTLRPLGLARLLARFAADIVVATAQVAYLAVRPGRRPRGAVIRVRLRSHSDLYLTLTAVLCSLVPGSLIVEAHRLTGTLYVHILDVTMAGGIEAARSAVLNQEERVLRALASRAELEEAGLT